MAEETTGQNDTDPNDASTADDTLLTTGEDTSTTGDQTVSTEGDTATGDQDTGDAGDKDASTTGDQVPETYEFTMPEGVPLDEGLAERAQGVFKELGLTQPQADKLTAMVAEQRGLDAKAGAEGFREQLDGWVETLKADTEVGGENFDKNAGIAFDAVEKLGSPELKQVLNSTGLGNNPELFKFCLKVGKMLAEDQPGSGDSTQGEGKIEDRLYGDTTPKAGEG